MYEASSTRCCHARIQAFLLLFLTEPDRPLPPAAQAKKPPGAGFFLGLWEDPTEEDAGMTMTPAGMPAPPGGGGGGGGSPPPPIGGGGGGGGMTTIGSGMTLEVLCLLLDPFFGLADRIG